MARNRRFQAPKEEFPEDEELVMTNANPKQRMPAIAEDRKGKGKGRAPPPDSDDPDEAAEDSRKPLAKGKKKPPKRGEEPQDDEEESPPKGKHGAAAKKGKSTIDEEKPEEPPKKPPKGGKAASKPPPADFDEPPEDANPKGKKPPPKGKKVDKPTTDEDFQPDEDTKDQKKGKGKNKKDSVVAPTAASTPRSGGLRGRLCSRLKLLGFAFAALQIGGVGLGVASYFFDWVSTSDVKYSLYECEVLGTTKKLQDIYDDCKDSSTSECEAIKYYYATSIIMLALGSLGLLAALAEAVLMVLHLVLASFSHQKMMKRALPAAPAMWVLAVAAMVVGMSKLRDEDSDYMLATGMIMALADVGLLAGAAGYGFWAIGKVLGHAEEEEEVQSTRN